MTIIIPLFLVIQKCNQEGQVVRTVSGVICLLSGHQRVNEWSKMQIGILLAMDLQTNQKDLFLRNLNSRQCYYLLTKFIDFLNQ